MPSSFKTIRNISLISMTIIVLVMGFILFFTTTQFTNNLFEIVRKQRPRLELAEQTRNYFLDAREIFNSYLRMERKDVLPAVALMKRIIDKSEELEKNLPKDDVINLITAAKRFRLAVITYAEEAQTDITGSRALEMERIALTTAADTEAASLKLIKEARANIKEYELSMFAISKKIQKISLIGIMLGGGTGLLLIIFLGHSLKTSLNTLALGAQEIARGHLNYRIKIETHDEIGSLAEAFNQMAEALDNSIQKEKKLLMVAEAAVANEKKKTEELSKEIAERKEAEKKLKTAYDQLRATQDQLVQSAKMASVGLLAGGVAHEINNPLTGILNNVQLIGMTAQKKTDFNMNDFKELLAAIEESAMRCKRITQSLLDFSHVSNGLFAPLSLNEIINTIITLVEHEIKLSNTVIQKELEPNLPLISGDSQLLQQVVFDVISNAAWAVRQKPQEDGSKITLKTTYEPEKKSVCLSVSDNGVGIKKETMDRIFEPFFTTKVIGEGTGLGLSIVYKIIKAHHGTIQVESEEAKGTILRIRLPVA